jgi:hypothetical protein
MFIVLHTLVGVPPVSVADHVGMLVPSELLCDMLFWISNSGVCC